MTCPLGTDPNRDRTLCSAKSCVECLVDEHLAKIVWDWLGSYSNVNTPLPTLAPASWASNHGPRLRRPPNRHERRAARHQRGAA